MKRTVALETNPVGVSFENKLTAMLSNLQMTYVIKPGTFVFEQAVGGRDITYRPDVYLPENPVDNRKTLLEPHGSKFWTINVLQKLNIFMRSEHHDGHYLIVITDDKYKEYFHNNLNKLRLRPIDIADEVWMLHRTDEMLPRPESLKTRTRSKSPA
ncbi:MAG: hypothetical protein KGH60_03700 [Candidatus Micrarchaeota archaeon]|nr:hypothetical protein [Candidatus Micrarchaeota archaeon]